MNQVPEPPNKHISTVNRRLIVAIIILLPLGIFLMMANSKQRFRTLPVYKLDSLDARGDSVVLAIPPFGFTDQTGKPFGTQQLKGKIHIADFFFTNCPGICKQLSSDFALLQTELKDFPEVELVSYSIDPTRDSVPALAAYAKQYGADAKKWHLLTGDPQALFSHSKDGYKLPAYRDAKSPDDGIVHANVFVLVDPDMRIRGYYDCTHPNPNMAKQEHKRLMDEVKVLLYEYATKKKPA
jgi:protein SCO1